MEFINMNINFSNMIKQFIPFVIVVCIAYILSSILYFMLPKKSIEVYKKQNITLKYRKFNIKRSLQDKIIKEKPVIKVEKQEYKLLSNITLKAVYSMNAEKAWIIISDKTKKTYMLSIGESFKEYKLIRVYYNYVIFKKSNQEYKLELNDDKSKVSYSVTKTKSLTNPKDDETIIVLDDKVSVKRAYLNSYINNFDKIWKDIAIKEIKDKNGNINGFKVTSIKLKSVFEKLGLKKGDIIIAVNNIELKSYNDAFNIYKKINKINDLNIRILRNDREMELDYEIE